MSMEDRTFGGLRHQLICSRRQEPLDGFELLARKPSPNIRGPHETPDPAQRAARALLVILSKPRPTAVYPNVRKQPIHEELSRPHCKRNLQYITRQLGDVFCPRTLPSRPVPPAQRSTILTAPKSKSLHLSAIRGTVQTFVLVNHTGTSYWYVIIYQTVSYLFTGQTEILLSDLRTKA